MMATTTIAVLGAGNIGGILGRKWVEAGHSVVFGVADPNGAKARALRTQLGERVAIGTTEEALRNATVVVFAIPGDAMEQTIAANALALEGKIVIDAANRMGASVTDSRAAFQQHAPNARYVRAFNTLGFENFADPLFDGVPADLFYVGPEADSILIEQLIAEIGLRPIRVGDSDQVAIVDGILQLWFALAIRQKKGRHLAFKVLTR